MRLTPPGLGQVAPWLRGWAVTESLCHGYDAARTGPHRGSLSLIEFKVFGVAMAVAVLIDATIVRGVLLPAGLALLGDRAWTQGPRGPRGRRGSRRAEVAQAAVAPVTNGVPGMSSVR